jgi:hypothetical protein
VIGPGVADGMLAVDVNLEAPWQMPDDGGSRLDRAVHLGVRPEWWHIASPREAPGDGIDGTGRRADAVRNRVRGRVTEVVYLGAVARCQVEVRGDLTLTAEVHDPEPARIPEVGEVLDLSCAASRILRFPAEP